MKVLLDEVPQWAEEISQAKYTREPADAYIVALANIRGFMVVTNEKHRNDRSRNNRRGIRIPDVCDQVGVPWLYLADFIATERLTR